LKSPSTFLRMHLRRVQLHVGIPRTRRRSLRQAVRRPHLGVRRQAAPVVPCSGARASAGGACSAPRASRTAIPERSVHAAKQTAWHPVGSNGDAGGAGEGPIGPCARSSGSWRTKTAPGPDCVVASRGAFNSRAVQVTF
jgi:hypothetical protein